MANNQARGQPRRLAVLMMAYGGPESLDDVRPYLMDVRNYRPTSDTVVAEITERYAEIGGRSPILELTRAQGNALQDALKREHDSDANDWRVFVGMRHWHPFIKDVLAEMAKLGYDRAVGLVMAPHYSRMSIGAYYARVAEAGAPVEVAPIERWHLLPGYLGAVAERVRAALRRFPDDVRAGVPVIFTAHSLPEKIQTWDDPYPKELQETADAVGQRIAPQPFTFAFQSAAMTPDPWLGPDAGEVIAHLAEEGHRNLLIAPIGFVCEHVEILYDIDIEFRRQVDNLGVHLERIEMVNAHPGMIEGLANLVRARATEAGWLANRHDTPATNTT
ncbi:MAG: ferrochelatase [Chloroflexota bacterium]|nr:ferrochelatase [Chloroflexota bacterium]